MVKYIIVLLAVKRKKKKKTGDPSRTHTPTHVTVHTNIEMYTHAHISCHIDVSTQTVFDNNANAHLDKWHRYRIVDLCSFMGEQQEKEIIITDQRNYF